MNKNMKKGKIILSIASIFVLAAVVFNFDYFKSLLSSITNKAAEVAVSSEDVTGEDLEKVLDDISADKFFKDTDIAVDADDKKSIEPSELVQLIRDNGLSEEEFHKYRVMKGDSIEDASIVKKMKQIREAIPEISNTTLLRKVIPYSQVEKYIGDYGWDAIQGCICRNADVKKFVKYDDIIQALRLDYLDNSGNRVFPDGFGKYAYILFTTESIDKIETPFCNNFGGTYDEPFPFTGNGFTSAPNKIVVPEYHTTPNMVLRPNIGAELHIVEEANDVIVAIYDGEHFRKVEINK